MTIGNSEILTYLVIVSCILVIKLYYILHFKLSFCILRFTFYIFIIPR